MSIWLTITLGAGVIAAIVGVLRPGGAKGVYANGIIERCFETSTDDRCLQVRAYVAETLVDELPAQSKLIGRMFIRGTDTIVPLTFDRVLMYFSPKIEQSDERLDVPSLPVIFRFDPPLNLAVHPGQLVDVYIGEG
jgi:hypothetical protein